MTSRIMRRASVLAGLLILTLTAASSPVQRSHLERHYPLSRWDSVQAWNPMRLLTRKWNTDASDSPLGLDKRQTYNCTDLEAAFDSRCWDDLGLSDYLFNWNVTTRVCSTIQSAADNDGSDCCKPNEPWTTCYLRLAHGTPGSDCSEINSQFCSYTSTLNPYMDSSIKPQVQYIMKNIYGKSPAPAYLEN